MSIINSIGTGNQSRQRYCIRTAMTLIGFQTQGGSEVQFFGDTEMDILKSI